jgi:hypothetical protein
VRGAAIAGVGLVLAGMRRQDTARADDAVPENCTEDTATILRQALVAERLAASLYYHALTSPDLMHDHRLGGSSTDPLNPGYPPNGNPARVRALQAALSAEVQHAALLVRAGASSSRMQFSFPPTTFAAVGTPSTEGSFAAVLDTLETALVGIYAAAFRTFLSREQGDLAALAAQTLGVEAEHRFLGRVLADALPANNLTLQKAPFACVGDAATVLAPFLATTPGAAASRIVVDAPTSAQAARVIGPYGTHLVTKFL